MIAVQSLFTRTPQWRLNRGALLLHTFSLCLIRRQFDYVELVTDEAGILIADRLRWRYDSFRIDCQFIPGRIRHIWAAGKICAQRAQSRPYVHIDNDFLLFDPLPEECRRAGVFVQGKDEASYYLNPDHLQIFDAAAIPRGTVSYNAGVIGGNDVKSLHGYCDYAFDLMQEIAELNNGTVLSIIAEQAGFGHFCRENQLSPVELIPFPLSAVPADFNRCRFVHLWSNSKKEHHWQAKVERRFKAEFPSEHAGFTEAYPLVRGALTHPRRLHVAQSYGIAKPAVGS